MLFRIATLAIALSIFSACSSGANLVPSQQSSIAATSAVRVPAAELERARRSRDAVGASAYPISALAFPISALAFPISALAYAGAPPTPTLNVCISSGKKKNDGGATCKSQLNTAVALNPDPGAAPSAIGGIQPATLQYIYDLPQGNVKNQTVAMVVAYDDPNAESDLAVYRNAFGFSPCTTANGCFKKVAGSGTELPVPDAGWSVEASLDLDAVSAVCPSCNLLLVEAKSNLIPDLANAVDTAVADGATVVSNSYGVAEAADNVQYASHYQHPGVPITAAAGDLGYGVQFPASVPTVTAVGGTSVQQIGNGAIQEVVWPLTGGGCSAFFAKPAWQTDSACRGRTANDVAIIADPADGISVYDSTLPNTASGGWSAVGGTSLGAPLVAGLFAMAASSKGLGSNSSLYAAVAVQKKPTLLNVTSGSNGSCGTYLCSGGAGYNGPTGVGVPWGIGAFAPAK